MERTTFLAKIESLVPLSDQERQDVAALPMERVTIPRRHQIIAQNSKPDFVYTILSGWAARYELRADGARRITGFLLPGDFCGIHALCGAGMDHAVIALTDCEIGKIDETAMSALVERSPAIHSAVWRAKLIEEATLRKWLLYAADARQGIAHLLCELYVRAAVVGLAADRRCHLPLTQEEIGDAMGITAVHTNRVVQRLRLDGLIDIAQQQLTIKDAAGLRKAAEFDGSYLEPWLDDKPPTPLD